MRAHVLASENMDLQVVRCMDRTRLRNEIETKINIFKFFLFWKLSKYGDLRMHISILRISV